jgi:UDP-N-acetylglucosamine 4,6-dehydratase/5-epimerase
MELFKEKTILVTGGCGSIGSEIVKQLLEYGPSSIRVLDNSEEGHFKLKQKINDSRIRHLIGDIRDRERAVRAMEGADIVFHAAALKHVNLCEYNPFEAVSTNVIGTKNLVDVAIQEKVDCFIGISTDKAVSPINTMGATKLLSEKIITNAPIGKNHVRFGCVRFGNVLNSSGSVIPIFKKQIQDGNEITITDEKMTRFFMDLPDAINLVLKAATQVKGGETFVLKMQAIKIQDLAEVLVEELAPKYGKDPKDFKYKIIGARPGEKIDECLLTKEESDYTVAIDDMLILRNSLLAKYGSDIKNMNNKINHAEYNSSNVKLLNKEGIRNILYEKNLI